MTGVAMTSTERSRKHRKAKGVSYDRAYARASRRAAQRFREDFPELWEDMLNEELTRTRPSGPGHAPDA